MVNFGNRTIFLSVKLGNSRRGDLGKLGKESSEGMDMVGNGASAWQYLSVLSCQCKYEWVVT